MRVFITGGAGFIGSHLCDALVARGDDVTVLDNLTTGSTKNIAHIADKLNLVKGDIRDEALVHELTRDADLVLHMAAALGVNTILHNPIESISTNFNGSEVVLNSAAKFHKRIIIASTSEIYGKNTKVPLVETDDRIIGAPQKIRWTYSDAKALEEAIAQALFMTKKTPVTTVRFFNTVGPRQTGMYGMVVPRFVSAALKIEPITVYGDGSQSRVFGHVLDAVDAVLKIADNEKTIGEVYNIGGEGEITIMQLAERIIARTTSKSEIKTIPYNQAYTAGFEDMQRRVPSTEKLRTTINWLPQRDLNTIIDDVAASMN